MLRTRLITAFVLLVVMVPAILLLPSRAMAVVLLGVTLLAAFEWQRLAGCKGPLARWAYPAVTVAACAALWPWVGEPAAMRWVGALGSAWWFAVSAYLLRHRTRRPRSRGRCLGLLAGLPAMVPSWFAMASIHAHPALGPGFLLFTFVLVWSADSGAYFAGRAFGRSKLAPSISPGKTLEGVAGGLVLVAIMAALAHAVLPAGGAGLAVMIGVALVAALVSIAGDLLVSLFKRQRGMKDSGNLLPGHGGVLDRVDSMLAAPTVLLLGWTIAGTGT